MANSVKQHQNGVLVILVCMVDAVRTLVQVSTAHAQRITLALAVSMSMMLVLKELVVMVPLALTMVQDTPASVHTAILVRHLIINNY